MIPLPVTEIAAITGGTLLVDHLAEVSGGARSAVTTAEAVVTGPVVTDSRQEIGRAHV